MEGRTNGLQDEDFWILRQHSSQKLMFFKKFTSMELYPISYCRTSNHYRAAKQGGLDFFYFLILKRPEQDHRGFLLMALFPSIPIKCPPGHC